MPSSRPSRLTGALAALSLAVGFGLASNASAGILYGLSLDTDALYTINPTNGEATLTSTLNGDYADANLSGLAILNGTFYASAIADANQENYELVSINPLTGATTLVADLPNDNFFAAAGDDANGVLYLADNQNGTLVTFDPQTSALTTVGTYDAVDIDGLAYDQAGTLYGVSFFNDELYAINAATGETTLIGPTGFEADDSIGLGFDTDTGTLYAVDGDDLYTLDTATGAATFIGTNSDGIRFTGLDVLAVPEPALIGGLMTLGGLVLLRRR